MNTPFWVAAVWLAVGLVAGTAIGRSLREHHYQASLTEEKDNDVGLIGGADPSLGPTAPTRALSSVVDLIR